MKYTENYNLKKPEAEDFYNVEDFNENADIIDQALKTHDDALATKETPEGAQEKADAALNSAKQYTDQEVDEVAQELATHKADGRQHAKTARFVIGTSTSGWTAADCDYLCDGTNDQVEINNAINALPATGGEVIILDGTYNITAKININKDNVSIRGNGSATILKRMWNSSSPEGVIFLTSVKGCRVENLQIDGNKETYTASNNYGIHIFSSSNNTITGNTCNNSNYGIYLSTSSNDNTVMGNTCNNNKDGIRLYSSTNNTITGNTCNDNNNYGIYLSSSSNNMVTGNTCIRGTGTPGDYTTNQHTIILVGTNNNYNLITSNNCMGKAVVVEGGTGNTVFNNKWDASDDMDKIQQVNFTRGTAYVIRNFVHLNISGGEDVGGSIVTRLPSSIRPITDIYGVAFTSGAGIPFGSSSKLFFIDTEGYVYCHGKSIEESVYITAFYIKGQ